MAQVKNKGRSVSGVAAMCAAQQLIGERRDGPSMLIAAFTPSDKNESAAATRDYRRVLVCVETVFAILFKASCQREIRRNSTKLIQFYF